MTSAHSELLSYILKAVEEQNLYKVGGYLRKLHETQLQALQDRTGFDSDIRQVHISGKGIRYIQMRGFKVSIKDFIRREAEPQSNPNMWKCKTG